MAKPNHLLRTAREMRHWSQQVLAYKLNATRITINRWEQGKSFPGPHFRTLLCSLFEMTESELGLTKGTENVYKLPSCFLPFPRNLFFTGREEVLQRLYHTFRMEASAALAQVQVISGLGGIGKTQIAIEYAYRFRDCYSTILWLQTETCDLLIESIAKLAPSLHLPSNNSQQLVSAFSEWLFTHRSWLLILDGVDDMELIYRFLPPDFNGHVILTTQSQVTGPFSYHIHLESLSPEEGALFLLRSTKCIEYHEDLSQASPEQQMYALQLSHILGGHPLALDQATAFIEETGCHFSDYLKCFRQHKAILLNMPGTIKGQCHHTVFTAISQALEQVKRTSPYAFDLLCLCAFLYPDNIPEEIVRHSVVNFGSEDPFALNAIFVALRTCSLLYRDRNTHLLSVHRLVQIVIRENMSKEERQLWAHRALQVLYRLFPRKKLYEDPARWTFCDLLLPHALAVVEHIEDTFHDCPYTESSLIGRILLRKALCYLNIREGYVKAAGLYSRETALGKYPTIRFIGDRGARVQHSSAFRQASDNFCIVCCDLRYHVH